MTRIHIVTDSAAHFADPNFLLQNPVTVVPNKITLGGQTYREDVDIRPEEVLAAIATENIAPVVKAPSVFDYIETYSQLTRNHDVIISIHASRELFSSWLNAKVAAQHMMGHCEIVVLDSLALCAAQGMLVQVAAQAVQEHQSPEEIVRLVRGAIDRVYAMYYVETIEFLQHSKVMSTAHVILGTMLGIKPCLSIENGVLMPVEKVRTRSQAIERLVEFATEFVDIENVVILQPQECMSEPTRLLQDRLLAEFPGLHFPHSVYSASLGCLIGADALGVVILEQEANGNSPHT